MSVQQYPNPLTQLTQHYFEQTGQNWLRPMRDQALEHFVARGLPHRKEEDWRYTDLSVLDKTGFQLSGELTDVQVQLPEYDCHVLTFINGCFAPTQSRYEAINEQIEFLPLTEAVHYFEPFLGDCLPQALGHHRYPLATINRALLQNGYYIYLPQSAVVDKPIHIIHYSSDAGHPSMSHIGHLLWAGPNSEATIIEEYRGESASNWSNITHQFYLKPQSRITYYKLQNDGSSNIHTDTFFLECERDSRFNSANYTLGSQLSRDDWLVRLNEQGSECDLHGLYMPKGRQLLDHHLQIEHNAPLTQSNVFYKGMASDRGKAVYNGRVIVPQDSQKVVADQYNPNLLLSNKAEINAKPELLINADDVRCTHGSTVGHIDRDALNYIRCRGLSYESALGLLLYAFALEAVNQIRTTAIKDLAKAQMLAGLPFEPPRAGDSDDNNSTY